MRTEEQLVEHLEMKARLARREGHTPGAVRNPGMSTGEMIAAAFFVALLLGAGLAVWLAR